MRLDDLQGGLRQTYEALNWETNGSAWSVRPQGDRREIYDVSQSTVGALGDFIDQLWPRSSSVRGKRRKILSRCLPANLPICGAGTPSVLSVFATADASDPDTDFHI